jgi:uncharacterized protein
MRIDDWLLDILACPECHAPLRVDEDASELVCTSDTCGLAYPVRDDIPVLLVEEARRPGASTTGAPGAGATGASDTADTAGT